MDARSLRLSVRLGLMPATGIQRHMKELRTLRPHCEHCGARNFRMFVVNKPDHVEQFLGGDALDCFKSCEA